jgi:hypothetical protein
MQSEQDTVTKTVSGTTPPQTVTYCSISAFNGVFDGDYDSTVTLKLKDGTSYKLKSSGHFRSSAWSDANSECHDVPLDQAPKDDHNNSRQMSTVKVDSNKKNAAADKPKSTAKATTLAKSTVSKGTASAPKATATGSKSNLKSPVAAPAATKKGTVRRTFRA